MSDNQGDFRFCPEFKVYSYQVFMASLETCHFPHEARVVVVVDVAVVDVAVVVIIVTSMSTLLQSLPKDPMQHSSPDLYHPEQSGVGPVIPIPLFVLKKVKQFLGEKSVSKIEDLLRGFSMS